MNLCVFTYDFPHRRSFEFLLTLILEDIPVRLIIAAPWKRLPIRPLPNGLIPNVRAEHPQKIAALMHTVGGGRTAYISADHADASIPALLQKYSIDFGLIAGARILPEAVVSAIPNGILNVHPGKLPDVRGNDPWLWAVKENIQPTITGHLITPEIDRGLQVFSTHVGLHPDDTLGDLYERLHSAALFWLGPMVRTAYGDHEEIHPIRGSGKLFSRIDDASLADVRRKFPAYREQWKAGTPNDTWRNRPGPSNGSVSVTALVGQQPR